MTELMIILVAVNIVAIVLTLILGATILARLSELDRRLWRLDRRLPAPLEPKGEWWQEGGDPPGLS